MTPRILLVGAVTARVMAMGVAVGRSLLKRMRPGQTKSSVLERGEDGRVEPLDSIVCDAVGTTVVVRKGRDTRERDKVTLIPEGSRVYWVALDSNNPLVARSVTHVYVPGHPLPVTNDENKVHNPTQYDAASAFGTVTWNIRTVAVPADRGLLCPHVKTGYLESLGQVGIVGGAVGHDPIDFYRRELLDKDNNAVTDVAGREPEPDDHYGVHRYSRSFAKPGEVSRGVYRGTPGRLYATFVSDDGGVGSSVPRGLYAYSTKQLRVVEVSANSVITGEIESEFTISGYYDYRYARDGLTGATEFIATVSMGISSFIGDELVTEYHGAGVLYVNREIVEDNSPLPIHVLPVTEAEFSSPFARTGIDGMTVEVRSNWSNLLGLPASDVVVQLYSFDRKIYEGTTPAASDTSLSPVACEYCFGHDNYLILVDESDKTPEAYEARVVGTTYAEAGIPDGLIDYGGLERARVIEPGEDGEIVRRAALFLWLGDIRASFKRASLHYASGEVVDLTGVVVVDESSLPPTNHRVCAATTDTVLQNMRQKDTGHTITAEVDRTVIPAVVRFVSPAKPATPDGLFSSTPTGNGYAEMTMNFPTTEYN